MVTADEEDEEEDEEDIDFEDEDFEGEIVFLFGLHAIIHKQPMVLRNHFVFFIQMTKKTCLSTIWRRNLILPLPHQGHETTGEPYILIIEALFWIEIVMQDTGLALRSIQSPYPQISKF